MATTSRFLMLLACCAILCAMPSLALAYPGAINLIPCVDMVGADNVRLSYEADGHNQPYDDSYTEYVYTQFGIGDKLELGLDVYDTRGASTKYFNAKYLVTPESDKMPAVALGTMFVGKDSKPSFYGIGCKSYGKTRLHLGAQTQSDQSWALVGADYEINDAFTLLADYQSGKDRYQTLGVYWKSSESFGVTLYYVRNNTASSRDDNDYVGLNFGYTMPLK